MGFLCALYGPIIGRGGKRKIFFFLWLVKGEEREGNGDFPHHAKK